jgi:hypothetical protein
MLLKKLELESGEEVIKIIRRHWFVIVSELIGVFFMAAVPIFLLTIALNLPSSLNVFNLPFEQYPAHITFFISAWLLFCVLSGFVVWTMYCLDVWVVTNRRLITINQNGFFHRDVAAFRLERLQDVQYSINGIVQTFFDYGTVSAQTAGESEAKFSSTAMPNPEGIQSLIQHAVDERLHEVGKNFPNRAIAEQQAGLA